MLDVIFAIKFVHMIAMAVMLGTWICIALFMLFAYRSRNASVAAVTALFTVRAEFTLMIPAIALQPLAGYPLAVAIGDHLDEYWFELSVAIYVAVVAAWLANLIVELRIRKVTQEAAVNGKPLPDAYRHMFWLWSAITLAGLAGMVAIMALMIWQPHWY
ncbi:MAG: DUF2269 family protein [Xanthobacteraceae bacterium]